MKIVLKVRHKDQLKMVGKVFPYQSGHAFYHEDTQGNQWHRNLNSPGGIDTCVLEWLLKQKVTKVLHFSQDKKQIYETTPETIEDLGQQQASDNRSRVYLDQQHWASVPSTTGLKTPWITSEIELSTV